jgi:hypothetical protein
LSAGNASRHVVVFTQNSFRDPLFAGPVLGPLRTLNQEGRYRFHVISYEQDRYRIRADEADAFDRSLEEAGIDRHSLDWGPGTLSRKGYELLKGYLEARAIARRHRPRAIFALGNVAGAFSYLIGRSLGMKVIVFTYEPHSEFMRECGVWSASSLKYRALHRMERIMGMRSDYIATGTRHMVDRLRTWGTAAKVFRVPSCVDANLFRFRPEARVQKRSALRVGDRPVFVYAGKFGDLYYREEIGALCRSLREVAADPFFLVLTPNPEPEVRALFARHGIDSSRDLHVGFAPLEAMPEWLSAADLGIVAVPPLLAQKFRSPIKVGEYLACGLPYVVCRGVSEDDEWAERHSVGVVVDDFGPAAVRAQADRFRERLREDKVSQRERCRSIGIAYRGQNIAVEAFSTIFREIYPE